MNDVVDHRKDMNAFFFVLTDSSKKLTKQQQKELKLFEKARTEEYLHSLEKEKAVKEMEKKQLEKKAEENRCEIPIDDSAKSTKLCRTQLRLTINYAIIN